MPGLGRTNDAHNSLHRPKELIATDTIAPGIATRQACPARCRRLHRKKHDNRRRLARELQDHDSFVAPDARSYAMRQRPIAPVRRRDLTGSLKKTGRANAMDVRAA